ncbi:phytanoyl-CoA dioxygenase family protein [Chitinimonas sp.]|uniref:phytanoyl-CoA dioxygenase family protein n=1 Tax=Chitinimonas sp. TaxID=1934313 RepID=UPI0035B02765
MPLTANQSACFARDGFVSLGSCLPQELLHRLEQQLSALHGGRWHGVRDALDTVPAVAELANSAQMHELAAACAGAPVRLARVLLFDKQAGRNWLVSWHQDRTIVVDRRLDLPGWGPWSRKEGQWHVQPPPAILQAMVTLRLHIDATNADNGCLRVIAGSHLAGLIAEADVGAAVAAGQETLLTMQAGELLAMRPLLLHASSKARQPGHRRVVHLEYCAAPLPAGLEWACSVAPAVTTSLQSPA